MTGRAGNTSEVRSWHDPMRERVLFLIQPACAGSASAMNNSARSPPPALLR